MRRLVAVKTPKKNVNHYLIPDCMYNVYTKPCGRLTVDSALGEITITLKQCLHLQGGDWIIIKESLLTYLKREWSLFLKPTPGFYI